MGKYADYNRMFTKLLLRKDLSARAQVLYRNLLALNDFYGWTDEYFSVDTSELLQLCNCSAPQLSRNRKELIDNNLISYRPGTGGSKAVYKIHRLKGKTRKQQQDMKTYDQRVLKRFIDEEEFISVDHFYNYLSQQYKMDPDKFPLEFVTRDDFRLLWVEWDVVRRQKKKKLTRRGIKRAVKKLKKLEQNDTDHKAEDYIDQSIEREWLSFFPIKDQSESNGQEHETRKRGENQADPEQTINSVETVFSGETKGDRG